MLSICNINLVIIFINFHFILSQTLSDLLISTSTTSIQQNPTITSFSQGTAFVVAWESDQDGSGTGIFAALLKSNFDVIKSEYQINSHTSNDQKKPASTSISSETQFIISWYGYGSGGTFGVYMKFFSLNGTSLTSDILVKDPGAYDELNPAMCPLQNGGSFLMTYTEEIARSGITGKIYSSSQQVIVGDTLLNQAVGGDCQDNSSVAAIQWGEKFVAVWESCGYDGNGDGIYARVYTGSAVSNEFRVNGYTLGDQQSPDVIGLGGDAFVVVWHSYGQDGDGLGIYARIFDSNGGALTGDFMVNEYFSGNQSNPAVTALEDGKYFVVTWQSYGQDGDGYGIFARVFYANGSNLTSEFQVNVNSNGDQTNPDIASINNGTDYLIVWQGTLDGLSYGIYSRSFFSFSSPGNVLNSSNQTNSTNFPNSTQSNISNSNSTNNSSNDTNTTNSTNTSNSSSINITSNITNSTGLGSLNNISNVTNTSNQAVNLSTNTSSTTNSSNTLTGINSTNSSNTSTSNPSNSTPIINSTVNLNNTSSSSNNTSNLSFQVPNSTNTSNKTKNNSYNLIYTDSSLSSNLKSAFGYFSVYNIINSIALSITTTTHSGQSSGSIWQIFTLTQRYYYFIFYNVELPLNLYNFLTELSFSQFNFIPKIMSDLPKAHSYPKFYENNMSGLFLDNCGSILALGLGILVTWIILNFFLARRRIFSVPGQAFLRVLINNNFPKDFIMANSPNFVIGILLQFFCEENEMLTIFSSIAAVGMSIYIVICIYRYRKKNYDFFFWMLRLLFVKVLVLAYLRPELQVGINCIVALAAPVYLILKYPVRRKKRENAQLLLFELIYFVASTIVIGIMGGNNSEDLGFVIMILILLSQTIFSMFVTIELYYLLKKIFKKFKKENKSLSRKKRIKRNMKSYKIKNGKLKSNLEKKSDFYSKSNRNTMKPWEIRPKNFETNNKENSEKSEEVASFSGKLESTHVEIDFCGLNQSFNKFKNVDMNSPNIKTGNGLSNLKKHF